MAQGYDNRFEYPRCSHVPVTDVCYECIANGDCERCMKMESACSCPPAMKLPWDWDEHR